MEESINDEISLKELILKLKEWSLYLFGRWKFIVSFALVVGVLSTIIVWTKPQKYKAELTFVLEEDKGASSGGLASLANQFGLGGSLGNGGGLFAGENLMYLMKSRVMIQRTLLSEVVIGGKKEQLIERYLAVNNVRENWEKEPHLAKLSFKGDATKFSRIQDSIIKGICTGISKSDLLVSKPDKKATILGISYTCKNELFSKLFVEALMRNVTDYYVSIKSKKNFKMLHILERKADSIRVLMNNNIMGIATTMDDNPNMVRQSASVPSQRRKIDLQILTAAYGEVIKNIEATRFALQKETPLIQLVDTPQLPLERTKPGRFKILILASFLGGFLACLWLIVSKIFKEMMR